MVPPDPHCSGRIICANAVANVDFNLPVSGHFEGSHAALWQASLQISRQNGILAPGQACYVAEAAARFHRPVKARLLIVRYRATPTAPAAP